MALALGRLGEAPLIGVTGTDPAIIAGTIATIAAVILTAAFIPARRATRVNPVVALRAE